MQITLPVAQQNEVAERGRGGVGSVVTYKLSQLNVRLVQEPLDVLEEPLLVVRANLVHVADRFVRLVDKDALHQNPLVVCVDQRLDKIILVRVRRFGKGSNGLQREEQKRKKAKKERRQSTCEQARQQKHEATQTTQQHTHAHNLTSALSWYGS